MRTLLAIAFVLAPALAGAYPQFQLSSGNVRCNQCHFAPAGGGLINNYGRDEAADTISSGGNGRFLHGLWEPPSWLALGADARLAGVVEYEGAVDGVDKEFFPMQADLYARVGFGQFSAYIVGGVRGAERPNNVPISSLFISREHYVMWREGPTGWYARAGRFFAPYGLRLPEHTAYIERFLGFDLLEETYNLSGGYVGDDWELHLSAFIPDFVRADVGDRGSGASGYFERRQGHNITWGGQFRVSVSDEDTRAMGGLIGKWFFDGPRIMLMAEGDLVHQSFAHADAPRWQFAGFLGGVWYPTRGWMVQLFVERWDEDLSVKGVARDGVGAELQWFPIAHVEVGLYGHLQLIGTGSDDGAGSEQLLLQVHYYL